MPDYLTKEEIRQWRSSLEKITLEEYAKRLGKVINNEKETNDMVDVVYKHHSSEVKYVSNEATTKNNFKAEKISSLAQQSFEREKEISLEKVKRELKKVQQAQKEKQEAKKSEINAEIKHSVTKAKKEVKVKEVKPVLPKASIVKEEVQVTFKKNLTPREQAVFEHFINHKNSIVYAKELAQVLDLPRDYVYKYIKNLRAKMNENAIQNADNGGFILEIK